jgi:hypothetical protein
VPALLATGLDMDVLTKWVSCAAAAGALAWACAGEAPGVVVIPGDSPAATGPSTTQTFFTDDEPALGGAGVTCGPRQGDSTCGGQIFPGKSVPLDIYIMFDQSASMCSCLDAGAGQLCLESGCNLTRLDAIRQATEAFLLDPSSAGIGVGIGFFGQQAIGETSCDSSSYVVPAVRVGILPEHAAPLRQALNRLEPTGETPTGPALRGACGYALDHRATTPEHHVVLLLLTDGRPEAPSTCRGGAGSCCPSLNDAVLAAEECARVGIRTFVLGVGPLLGNLEQIAVAGGTGRAYLVQGGDVSTEVLNALNRIRGDAAIPCELDLPEPAPGRTLAFDAVNLDYEAGECELTPFYAVRSAADCGGEDGWHYDNPAAPGRIFLCPRSCDRVSGPGGNLFYSVGCATRIR